MKKFSLFIVFILCSFGLFAQSAAWLKESKIPEYDMKANAGKFLKNTDTYNGENYDLKYNRFEWYIDPNIFYIAGKVTTYFKTTQASVSQITFDMRDTLITDSVMYHGSSLAYTHSSNTLTVNLPSSLTMNTLDSVRVIYHGSPDSSGFGSFIKYAHNGTPIIWTLSEPFGAMDWWPCKNTLCDKIDSIDVIVTCPQAYRTGSNGVLVSDVVNAGNRTCHWKSRYAISAYLIAIAVTNYSFYSNWVPIGADSIEVLNYVFPEDLATAMSQTPDVITSMTLYNNLFIPYPFKDEKYGHAEFMWGGGMEHQTMTFLINFGYGLMAHELAHQWFGDMITCDSWHNIWINESFATYLTGLNYEKGYGDITWSDWKSLTVNNITSATDGSVYCPDTTNVNRIFDGRLSYNKGAYLLHMLRWVVGDTNFFHGMRDYLNDPALAYGYAGTDDYKAHMEAASGMNLTGFFNDWFTGEGYPSYDVHCIKFPANNVQVTINQTQSHASVSFFEMPVPIYFSDGVHDTTIVFNHTYSGQTFSCNPGFDPTTITFDPELHICSKNNILTVNVDKIQGDYEFTVSPNPAYDRISISYKNLQVKQIEIMDVAGKSNIVASKISANNNLIQIDLSKYAEGTYFVKALVGDGYVVRKIIKF